MIQFLLAVLFNSLWVTLLVALAIQIVFWLVPRTNATTRYAAWTLGLLASVVLSVAITLPHLSTGAVASAPSASVANVQATKVVTAGHATSERALEQPAGARVIRATAASTQPPSRVHLSVPMLLAPLPFVLWALVALFIMVRLIVALAHLEALKRDALPVPIDVRDGLSAWGEANKGDRGVRLCTSERITVPVAVGLFDSLILIPSKLLANLSSHEIDQILLHELAHLRRADDWTNCLQRVIEALFFFNPAMLWMARKLDIEREVACDDWVVTQTRDIRPYALCLTRMAEVTAWPHRALAAPGVFITRKSLSIRVERLLAAGRNIGTSIALGPAGIVAAAIVVLVFIAKTVAPSIAFTLPSPPQPVAPPHLAVAPIGTAKPAIPKKPATTPKPAVPALLHTTLLPTVHVAQPKERVTQPMRATAPSVPIPPAIGPAAIASHRVAALSHPHVHRQLAEQSAVAAGTLAAANLNCTGCDFGNAHWSGRDLRGSNLPESDFAHADLSDANFSGANLTGADFEGANLTGANFANANLSGASLKNADLSDVNFSNANLSGVSLDFKRLSPAQARTILPRCNGCDMSGANLRNQDLRGVTLTGIDLANANLSGADLRGARFAGVDLSHAILDGAQLDGAVFTGCDFAGTDLRNVDLSKTRIAGSDLSTAILR